MLLLGNESRLIRLGMVAVGGIKIEAKAPRNGQCAKAARRNSVPKLAAADRRSAKAQFAEQTLTASAGAADAKAQPDPQALPAETPGARR